jgi:hypothetical protein
MAVKYSEVFINRVLDSYTVVEQFNNIRVKLFSGTVPDSAEEAISGDSTLLLTYDNSGVAGTFDSAADNGVLPKAPSETWSGTAVAGGTATYFRAYNPTSDSDDGEDEDDTAPRIQGTVGVVNADLNMPSVDIVLGNVYTLDYFAISVGAV